MDSAPRVLASRLSDLSRAGAARNAQCELQAHHRALDELDERLRQVCGRERRPAA